MTVSELINKLNSIYVFHGDVEVEIQDEEIIFLNDMDYAIASITEDD